MSEIKESNLDKEWVKLMLLAKEIGLSIAEVRDYLNKKSKL
ncbi:anti-repressor SinI family protein [Pullulanibacillus sp. KACC 23026]|nr:anti-repressor SinI family protein [Pullulanibacillus sp. KACC 23026]WEG13337.1 anti-repressor SinI family protein [Pullulanibacillus sp. KACC 23026]